MGILNYVFGLRSLVPIERQHLVLEVGSGGNPFLRSDVLCDRAVFDSCERDLGLEQVPLVVDRAFVCGDAEALPFRDKAFDCLLTSHMVEHLRDPARFLSEASRVARFGLIVTPSPECEQLFGSEKHLWLVGTDGIGLVLTAKQDAGGNGLLHDLFRRNPDFRRFWRRNSAEFETRYIWRHEVKYRVDYGDTEAHDWLLKAEVSSVDRPDAARAVCGPSGSIALAKRLLRKALYGERVSASTLRSLVACPMCHSPLSELGGHMVCQSCAVKYPVVGGVMYLVSDLAEPV